MLLTVVRVTKGALSWEDYHIARQHRFSQLQEVYTFSLWSMTASLRTVAWLGHSARSPWLPLRQSLRWRSPEWLAECRRLRKPIGASRGIRHARWGDAISYFTGGAWLKSAEDRLRFNEVWLPEIARFLRHLPPILPNRPAGGVKYGSPPF